MTSLTTYELNYCYYRDKRPSYNGVVVYGRVNCYKTDVSILLLVVPEHQNLI